LNVLCASGEASEKATGNRATPKCLLNSRHFLSFGDNSSVFCDALLIRSRNQLSQRARKRQLTKVLGIGTC
jgi:orotate phosphoribosyltransferase